jgi:hypothetical protein
MFAKILIVIIFVLFLIIFLMMMSFDAEYEQYDNNPFKRRCKKCGATQHRFTDGWNEWWEEMSSGDNRDCGCHHHVKQ